jgi:Flp pilus assembly protein TadG
LATPAEEQQQKLQEAEQDAARLLALSQQPNLDPAQAVVFQNLRRSALAEMKLRQKALQHLGAPVEQSQPSAPNPIPDPNQPI